MVAGGAPARSNAEARLEVVIGGSLLGNSGGNGGAYRCALWAAHHRGSGLSLIGSIKSAIGGDMQDSGTSAHHQQPGRR